VPADSCPRCGSDIPEAGRFCPNCGLALDQSGDTVVDELPPDETGTVPVHLVTSRPRLFGVTPPEAILVLGLVALGAAIVLTVGIVLVVGVYPQFFARVGELAFRGG